jgi:hypothetical protein
MDFRNDSSDMRQHVARCIFVYENILPRLSGGLHSELVKSQTF